MPSYRVIRKCQGPRSPSGPPEELQPGTVVEANAKRSMSPDYYEPVGSGQHNMALRRFHIPGYENLPPIRRAELAACAHPAPLRERLSLNHQAFSEFAEKRIEQLTRQLAEARAKAGL